MKQVASLYSELVESGKAASIRRYNLRKLCRSFDLPPCGVSFWELDDLNWDYLQTLNRSLVHERFVFRGGEHFPRSYWDDRVLGLDRRTEFIFLLTTGGNQHRARRAFFAHNFSDSERIFGTPKSPSPREDGDRLTTQFHHGLLMDLIHFSAHRAHLGALADFYLALALLTLTPTPAEMTRDGIFDSFKQNFPDYRADITRIKTATDLESKLDDILYLMGKLDG
ncbi:MAG: hypothetical protein QNK37_17405 [Acidobacteriota bacterium]|nr:hypothetical protein [Acidobacteriota bacterium]